MGIRALSWAGTRGAFIVAALTELLAGGVSDRLNELVQDPATETARSWITLDI